MDLKSRSCDIDLRSTMSSAPPMPVGINLGTTYGAYLIGAIAAAILYGIILLQVVFYFDRYPKDKFMIKALVVTLLLLDTMTLITETHGLYHYLIVNFGNFEVLLVQVWSVQVEALIAYTIMLITQAFFISRIWELGGRKVIIPVILTCFMFGAFGTAMAIVTKVFLFKFWSSSLLPYMRALVAANKTLETAADALITASLCYYLHRGRTGLKQTNSMINRLMVFAINRGAITTFLQLCYLIAFEAKADSMAWVAIHVAISKVYTNSVLATLNSRNAIRGVGDDQEVLSVRLNSTIKFNSSNDQSGSSYTKGLPQNSVSTTGQKHGLFNVADGGDDSHTNIPLEIKPYPA
ncbi:hypothetical protein B0H10DRAFT_354051 [Mycena sp. CBHHK59/15]|nr:hypothetical protein B0H10DRAFT_354051 [Mycena sp. CBHHK59/15]